MQDKVDSRLIKRINNSDEKAFEELYNSYFVFLCSYANSYIFNPDESQDIVNETFMKVWHKRNDLLFPIHSYLIKSVQNGCLNYLRHLQNQKKNIDEYQTQIIEFQMELCMNNENPLFNVEQKELHSKIKKTIDALPARSKVIFEEYLYSNLSPKEIAEKYTISVNTVRVHIKTAMDKLRGTLGKHFGVLFIFLF